MTLEELKTDLKNKTEEGAFFMVRLFKNDKRIYFRRSFDDLFKYYRRFGITEKLLLQALYETNFVAKACSDIDRIIFYRDQPRSTTFWGMVSPVSFGYSYNKKTTNTKYTAKYLDDLFKQIYTGY